MSEDKNSNLFSNAKLSTIFLVVLGLHIVVIVLISAYHLLKGDPGMEMAEQIEPPRPSSYESVFGSESREPAPQLETAYAGSELAEGEPTTSLPPMSMPAADDPIWTGNSPVERPTAGLPGGYNSSLPEPTFDAVPVSDPVAVKPRPTQPSVTDVPRETSIYTVQRGDTLSQIALRSGMSVTDLKKLNGLDSTLIRVGQKLQVSGKMPASRVAEAAPKVRKAPKAQVVQSNSYRVGKGDTLWRIAQKFDTTPQELARMNGISDPSKLKIGDTLKVPSGGGATGQTDMAMMPEG